MFGRTAHTRTGAALRSYDWVRNAAGWVGVIMHVCRDGGLWVFWTSGGSNLPIDWDYVTAAEVAELVAI